MQCPRCQQENSSEARFCNSCGAGLELICPSCHHSNPAGSLFCNRCAASLGAPPSPGGPRFPSPESYTPKHLAEKILTSRTALEGERKHVTVLFADLKGSMELVADRDPEEARKILDPVLAHSRSPSTVGRRTSRRPALRVNPTTPVIALYAFN